MEPADNTPEALDEDLFDIPAFTTRPTESNPLLEQIRSLLGDVFHLPYVEVCLDYALNKKLEELQFSMEQTANQICRRHPRPDTPEIIDHTMEAFPEYFGGEKTRWATSLYGQLYEEAEMSSERGYARTESCGVIIQERMKSPNYGFADFFSAEDWVSWLEICVCQHAADLRFQRGKHLPDSHRKRFSKPRRALAFLKRRL